MFMPVLLTRDGEDDWIPMSVESSVGTVFLLFKTTRECERFAQLVAPDLVRTGGRMSFVEAPTLSAEEMIHSLQQAASADASPATCIVEGEPGYETMLQSIADLERREAEAAD